MEEKTKKRCHQSLLISLSTKISLGCSVFLWKSWGLDPHLYIYQYNSINNKYSRHLWIFCIMDFFGFFWILFFILPAVPNMALCPGDCLCDNTRLVVNCTNVYLPDMPITLNPHIKVSYLLELKSDLQILFRRYCWRYLSEKNLRLENSDQY